MREIFRRLKRITLTLLLAVLVIGIWKRDQLQRLWAVNSLFSEEKIVGNFSNMNAAFLTRDLLRGDGPVSVLPNGIQTTLPPNTKNWITARTITSLIVLHKGQIVHESYYKGTGPEDRRIGWSVSKSYLSALFGVLVNEGKIASLDVPVTQYAPMLIGGAYDGVTIRNVLQMTSGVEFDEDYLEYNSDINKMGRVLALGGAMDDFAARLKQRDAEPGQTWHYVSIDTHVLGMVIRGATGRDIPSLLSEKIIFPLGQEAAPYYLTDGEGVAFVLGGLNQTTRDYARFGLMFEQGGLYDGKQVVPADWIAASTRASAPTQAGEVGYGYQWWMPKDATKGEFFGHGIYGQYIYIDRARDVVIVSTAADRAFRDVGVSDINIAMFRQIAKSL